MTFKGITYFSKRFKVDYSAAIDKLLYFSVGMVKPILEGRKQTMK